MYSVHMRESVYHVKLHRLIKLVRHTPAVRSCIQRVYNEIVPPSVAVQERGKDLTPKLQAVIGPVLAQFLEQALEMAFMCVSAASWFSFARDTRAFRCPCCCRLDRSRGVWRS
jgi:hypothetical protein